MRSISITAAAAAVLAATAALAGEQAPAAKRIDLGGVAGVAYYTAEADGLHVVATFASETDAAQFRVRGVLADGQKIQVSAPRGVNEPAFEAELLRVGDDIVVSPAASTVASQ